MPPIAAFWHLVGVSAAAIGVGGFSVVLAKLVWRGELRRRGLVSLWVATSAAALLAEIAGIIVFERDGRMATYAAMVVASAAAIAWFGFRAAKR